MPTAKNPPAKAKSNPWYFSRGAEVKFLGMAGGSAYITGVKMAETVVVYAVLGSVSRGVF